MPTTTWLADIERKTYPPLEEDISADVAVIGAGLAGSISAYLLAKEGKKVVLIDKGDIESATTAYTTAWITADIDTDIADQVKMYGKDRTKAIWESGNAAIDAYEKIIAEEKIDCEFVRVPVIEYALEGKDVEALQEEFDASEEAMMGLSLKKEKSSYGFPHAGSLEMPRQAKFHPLKFLQGIQAAAIRHGAQIFHFTEATDIAEEGSKIIIPLKSGKKITADYSVMATYQPFKNPKELFAKKGPYKSYVFDVEIPKGLIKEGLYQDTFNPYHYFRIDPQEEYDRMILGGEDHRMELPFPEDKSYRALEEHLKELVSGAKYRIVRRWAGNVLENVDGLPYIGAFSKKKPNQLVATAFSGNGMHFSMIAGGIMRDIILKRPNRDIELYDAGRKVKAYDFMKKAIDFTEELFGGAVKNLFK